MPFKIQANGVISKQIWNATEWLKHWNTKRTHTHDMCRPHSMRNHIEIECWVHLWDLVELHAYRSASLMCDPLNWIELNWIEQFDLRTQIFGHRKLAMGSYSKYSNIHIIVVDSESLNVHRNDIGYSYYVDRNLFRAFRLLRIC